VLIEVHTMVKPYIVDKWFYLSKIATVSELAQTFYTSANRWVNYLDPVWRRVDVKAEEWLVGERIFMW